MTTNNNVLDRIRSSLGQANQGGSFQAPSTPSAGDYPGGNGISLQGGMINAPGAPPKKLGTSIVSK